MVTIEADIIIGQYPTAWEGHREFGYNLVKNRKPKHVVELGTQWGHSLFAMVQAAKDNSLYTHFDAVDLWEPAGDGVIKDSGSSEYNAVKQCIEQFYPGMSIKLHKGRFDDRISQVKNDIDMLHIDGSHDYESVKNDFTRWEKKVVKGGIIMFHDIEVDSFGVKDVIAEIRRDHPDWDYITNNGWFGLGVFTKK